MSILCNICGNKLSNNKLLNLAKIYQFSLLTHYLLTTPIPNRHAFSHLGAHACSLYLNCLLVLTRPYRVTTMCWTLSWLLTKTLFILITYPLSLPGKSFKAQLNCLLFHEAFLDP